MTCNPAKFNAKVKMFKIAVLLVLFVGAFASPVDDRIIGGSTAQQGQFPYQISLRYTRGNSHTCGGTIINSRFIVTAAHCVYGQSLNDLFVVTGTNYLNSGGDAYNLVAGVYHGNYDPNRLVNDIALLKVDRDIQFNSYVRAIPLQTSEVYPGANLVLSGWGLTSYPGNIPNNLQYAYLTAIDTNQCAQQLAPGVITNTQICTFTRRGQGACQGDSGGPLVYNGALTGIVSWGRPCALGYPDVFTKVASFADWVNYNMQNM